MRGTRKYTALKFGCKGLKFTEVHLSGLARALPQLTDVRLRCRILPTTSPVHESPAVLIAIMLFVSCGIRTIVNVNDVQLLKLHIMEHSNLSFITQSSIGSREVLYDLH